MKITVSYEGKFIALGETIEQVDVSLVGEGFVEGGYKKKCPPPKSFPWASGLSYPLFAFARHCHKIGR